MILNRSCAILMWSFYIFAALSHKDAYCFFFSRGTSVATERTDFWGFSGDCGSRYRIETWYAENRRHGKNGACDSKNKMIAFVVKAALGSWVLSLLSTIQTFFWHKASHIKQASHMLCFPLAFCILVLRPCGLIWVSAECSSLGSWTLSL